MDELNELPQGWKWVKFEDIAFLQRGHDLTNSQNIKGEYPVVTSSGINSWHNQFTVKSPCVITGRSGSIGKVYYLEQDCWAHNTALFVKDFKGNNPKYIYFLLSFIDLRKVCSGSGVPTLDRKWVHKLITPHISDIKEQQRLATLLTAKLALIEQAKEKITAQLQAAQELTAAYLREVFESEEAKGWEWVNLGDIAIKISKGESPEWQGFSYTNHGIRFIRSENIQWGSFSDIKKTFIPLEFHNKLTRSKVTGGDILINLVGASIGRVCKCPNNIKSANINQAVAVISLSNYNSDFLVNFILTNKIQEHFKNVQVDVARPNISLTNLRDLPIPSISPDKQTQLANYLSEKLATVEQLKTILQTQLDSINQLPAALLKQAFSGKL